MLTTKLQTHIFVVMGTEGDYQPMARLASELDDQSNRIIFITPQGMQIDKKFKQIELNITQDELITLTVDLLGGDDINLADLWQLLTMQFNSIKWLVDTTTQHVSYLWITPWVGYLKQLHVKTQCQVKVVSPFPWSDVAWFRENNSWKNINFDETISQMLLALSDLGQQVQ